MGNTCFCCPKPRPTTKRLNRHEIQKIFLEIMVIDDTEIDHAELLGQYKPNLTDRISTMPRNNKTISKTNSNTKAQRISDVFTIIEGESMVL